MNSSPLPETTPVGVALAGYGYWGANLARNIVASSATTLIGVIDSDQSARDSAAARYPGITTWDRLEAALDDDRVEAVVVATPASTHAVVTTAVLESGRHALVEKPLANTPEEATDLLELAQEKDLTLMVGHTFLYSAPVNRLRDWIRDGELGRVQYVRSQRMSLGRVRRDINAFWNFAPHDISILMYLLDDRPVRVNCSGFSYVQPGVEDMCVATLEFSTGIGATVHVSWLDPIKTRLMTVVGTEKMAIYDDVSPDKPLALVDSGVARDENLGRYLTMSEFQWRTRAGDILIPKVDLVEPLLVEITDFGESCATGKTPRAHAQHGLEVVRVLAAADRSMKAHGAPVEIQW
ncbi:MAG TPA: Gfo/Idh/MocA family oxidoreductase [Acidimicrobiia bacterium]